MVDFSVVIPAYKAERFLAETLRSVLAQTLPPKEILVIDDGSPDGTAAVARTFVPAVTTIRIANSGVSDARNLGARSATGSWLAFLDADDVWKPDFLRACALAIAEAPNADVCYTGRVNLWQRGSEFLAGDPVAVPPPDELTDVLMRRCPFMPSTAVVRCSTFLGAGGFDGRFNAVEDWHLWLRLLHRGARFIQVEEPLVLYRVHAASATNNPLPVLATQRGVIEDQILPHLTPLQRATRGRELLSRLEGEAAILLREHGNNDALAMMLRSLATHPFHGARRYKIAAHMIKTALLRSRVSRGANTESG